MSGTVYLGNTTALTRIQGLQNTSWYKIQNLAPMLNEFRSVNYFVQAERTAALNTISNLPNDCPYAVALDNEQQSTANIRFPPSIAYVCAAVQPWNSYFQVLTSALSFKDRIMEKTMLTNAQQAQTTQSANTPSTTMAMSNISDASQAFSNVITNMFDAIAQNAGVFSQASFEQNFNVAWGVPAFMTAAGRFGKPVNTVVYYDQGAYEEHQKMKSFVVDYTYDTQHTLLRTITFRGEDNPEPQKHKSN
jgi:hypothetical protein